MDSLYSLIDRTLAVLQDESRPVRVRLTLAKAQFSAIRSRLLSKEIQRFRRAIRQTAEFQERFQREYPGDPMARFSEIIARARIAPETLTNEDRAIVGPHVLAPILGERCTCRICDPEPYRAAARRLARVQPRELDDPCDVL